MENKEIRRINLQILVDEAGSIIKLAERTEIASAYISQIINKAPSSNRTPRGMGNATARKLENKLGKVNGWMDSIHSEASSYKTQRLAHLNFILQDQPEYVIDEAIKSITSDIELLKKARNNGAK